MISFRRYLKYGRYFLVLCLLSIGLTGGVSHKAMGYGIHNPQSTHECISVKFVPHYVVYHGHHSLEITNNCSADIVITDITLSQSFNYKKSEEIHGVLERDYETGPRRIFRFTADGEDCDAQLPPFYNRRDEAKHCKNIRIPVGEYLGFNSASSEYSLKGYLKPSFLGLWRKREDVKISGVVFTDLDLVYSIPDYLALAEKGNVKAQERLVYLYKQEGKFQNYAEAEKWARVAAEAGSVRAAYELGMLLYYGRARKPEYKTALEWFEKAPKEPHVPCYIGFIYLKGLGVAQDYAKAAHWWKLDAEKLKNLTSSAAKGNTQAQAELAELYYKSRCGFLSDEMQKLFQAAAKKGNPKGQYYLGIYAEGHNNRDAAKWFRLSAKQGYAPAQVSLGNLYKRGAGVKQDFFKAGEWYRRAADQGDESGKQSLKIWEEDKTTAQDYLKRAESGDAEYQFYMARYYADGVGVRQDKTEALKWYRRAAEIGYGDAQIEFGKVLANVNGHGRGYPTDIKEAYFWILVGAETTKTNKRPEIKEIENKLMPDQIASIKRRAAEWKPTPTNGE